MNVIKMLKVASNETFTMHTICTWIVLEIFYNNDQQYNRHDFLKKIGTFNLKIRITTFKWTNMNYGLWEIRFG